MVTYEHLDAMDRIFDFSSRKAFILFRSYISLLLYRFSYILSQRIKAIVLGFGSHHLSV